MNQLGNFEQSLLSELREVVADRARLPAPRHLPAAPRRRIALAVAGGGLLAAAVVIGPSAVRGEQVPAAYAVEANDDGTVTVTVTRFEDADGLESQLEAHGILAEVDYIPRGTRCAEPRFDWADSGIPDGAVLFVPTAGDRREHGFSLRVRPELLTGRTLVVTHMVFTGDGTPDERTMTLGRLITSVAGPVAPCVLEDEPR